MSAVQGIDRSTIAEAIRAAFAHRRPPRSHEPLATGTGIDSTAVERDFRGRRWDELSFEVLLYNRDGLHFMTPAAFLYYLPAFALAGLGDQDGSIDILESLAFLTTPAPGCDRDERVRKRIDLFTREEKRALELLWKYYFDVTRPDESSVASRKHYEDEKRRMKLAWNVD